MSKNRIEKTEKTVTLFIFVIEMMSQDKCCTQDWRGRKADAEKHNLLGQKLFSRSLPVNQCWGRKG